MSDLTIIVGRRTVRELLRHKPENIKQLHIIENSKNLAEIYQLAKEAKIPLKVSSKEQISNLCNGENHQGVMALVKPRASIKLKELLAKLSDKERCRILLLDGVEDPQNFGSILRSAECFSFDAVLYAASKGVGITPTVTKVSVGASELLKIVSVKNLSETIKALKKANFWIITTDNNEKSESLAEFDFPQKSVIVLGSEGKGVSKLVKEKSDFFLKIELSGRIESLNVSQAGAVVMYATQALS